MYTWIKYSDNYSKTSGRLWQYYRGEPFLNANGAIDDFPADDNNSASFKFKTKIAGRRRNDGTKNVKIRVPLNYLSNFWRTLEMPLINCEINLILTWSARCFIIGAPLVGQEPTFTITDTKIYVPVVPLSTQNNGNYCENWNQVLKKQLNGLTAEKPIFSNSTATKSIFRFFNWSKFSRSK